MPPAHVHAEFTSRWGGSSAAPFDSLNLGDHVGDDPRTVGANRARVAALAGVDSIVWMNQVHGDRVVIVDGPSQPGRRAESCDGLVTAVPGLALGVLAADCVPILMSESDAGVVAAVHAGRLGTQADVALRALDAMQSVGADPSRVLVRLGPAICGACYEVPGWMQAEVAEAFPQAASTTRWGTPGLDLRAGLRSRLEGRVASVEIDDRCTWESPDHFSHRRDGLTGRTAGVVRFTR